VKARIFAIAATLLFAACTGSEPTCSPEDSKAQREQHDEILKRVRKDLRAGETDLVNDNDVRNGPK